MLTLTPDQIADNIIKSYVDIGLDPILALDAAIVAVELTLRTGVYPGYQSKVQKALNKLNARKKDRETIHIFREEPENYFVGLCGHFLFHARLLKTATGHGIDEGKVIELWIGEKIHPEVDNSKTETVVNFNNGEWFVQPRGTAVPFYKAILSFLETK